MLALPTRAKWAVIIAILGMPVAGLAQAPTTAPVATTQAALDPRVDTILTRLEHREVHDLRSKVTWSQEYANSDEEDNLTKRGTIWYQQGEPVARFMIQFDEKVAGDGRRDKLDERHLFDGRWYVKLESRTKTVERHEVRRAEDRSDPYRVGQGAFPLPFGQKKDEILREFSVELVPPATGDLPATDHLHLTPRPGTQTAESYKTLDFWVAQEGALAGLPVKVRVGKLRGTGQLDSFITVTFSEVELNRGFSQGVFDIAVPKGYTVIEEPLEPAAPPAGAREK